MSPLTDDETYLFSLPEQAAFQVSPIFLHLLGVKKLTRIKDVIWIK